MKLQTLEITRYAINGVIATAVHYGVLTANIIFWDFQSAGVANLIAAIVGVTVSFFGSRYFVYKKTTESIFHQALKFAGLYGTIAIFHGVFLWIWTDWQGFGYQIGFLIATCMQISMSYFGNKFLVFKI
jgi:putative flippase GtrA